MANDLMPGPEFRKLQWSLVAATFAVVIGNFGWTVTHSSNGELPVLLPGVNYDSALKDARYTIGGNAQRFCVLEFFDYQCPPCRMTAPKVRAVVLAAGGSLALHNRPLKMHPYARALALVACALNKTEFEKFHPKAFSLYDEDLKKLVLEWRQLLDRKHPGWRAEAEKKLRSEEQIGLEFEVMGTPSFFVVDRRKGVVYRCPTLNALRSVVSGT